MMTERGRQGEHNVGHLMRKLHGGQAFLVGFTTYTGEVRAAREWGGGGGRMKVRPALEESYSGVFHLTGMPSFLLLFRGNERLSQALREPRLERAIGVVYLPGAERKSHYFEARMSRQFDAVIHWDVTKAVEALH
jgi:erythromycin esterase-like protein